MKNVMIPEELFGKIIKYHLLDQEQEADDIRKGLEKKLDAMVNREVCKLRSNGMPVPLLRNGYSIFNGTKYR